MRLAVIPARGGSKRIPRKNVRDFAGKPMIAYAIEAAFASGLFERVVVSTDDDEIAAIARARGAELPFIRPAGLADDDTPTVPVIAHALGACRALGWDISHACCIYPGVPFLQIDDLARAFELQQQAGTAYSFPVTEFPSPIQRALRRLSGGRMEPIDPRNELARTQDLEPAFHDAAQFYWGTVLAWLTQPRIHSSSAGLPIPNWRVVDIDTHDDWKRAELLYRALNQTRT